MSRKKRNVISIIALVLTALMLFCVTGCGPSATETYTVTVVNGSGGGTFEKDESVTVTATIPEGKKFVNWTVGSAVVSTDNPYTFDVTEDVTVTANFTDRELVPLEDEIFYTVVVDGGAVIGADGSTQFKEGEEITVSAVTPDFFEFAHWIKDDGDKPYSRTLEFKHTVTGNVKFTAVYTAVSRYDLTLTGCTSASEYIGGSEFATVTANAIENYEFVDWTINGETVTTPSTYRFELTADTAVTANYKRINITVRASSTNDAIAVTVTGGQDGLFVEGDTAIVTAATKNGISVTWRDADGAKVSEANPYTFEVADDVNLTAHFGPIYTVNVTGGYIGSDTGLTSDIFGGGEVKITADVPDGWMFVKWVDENNEFVTQANPYIFTITGNVTLTAQIQEVPDATTYIFEAENADLSNCVPHWSETGVGNIAENHSNHNFGTSISDPDSYKASNGWAAMGFNDREGNTIVWTFNSNIASTAILVIRMANGSWDSEFSTKDMSLTSNGLGMYINDTIIEYDPITIEGKDLTGTGAGSNAVFGLFTDYTIVLEMPIKAGENVFYVKLLQRGSGPNIDCLKLTTSASLTWTPSDVSGAPVADYPWNITE